MALNHLNCITERTTGRIDYSGETFDAVGGHVDEDSGCESVLSDESSPLATGSLALPLVDASQQHLKRKAESSHSIPASEPFATRKYVIRPTGTLPIPCQPKVTQFQRDLNDLFQSIRRVFLVNHFSSNMSLAAQRDACVNVMKGTSQSYSHHNLVEKDDRQDYSHWQVRWGYVFMYLMRHAHLVLHSLWKLVLWLDSGWRPRHVPWNIPYDADGVYSSAFLEKCSRPGGVLRVCAIGGGPGSDLVGLALFLRMNHFPAKINARVLDLCGHWHRSWNSLLCQLPPYLRRHFVDVQYHPFDYLKPDLTTVSRRIVATADLVTIVKSVSPVATRLLDVEPMEVVGSIRPRKVAKQHSVFNILSIIPPGCLVLYVDNKCGKQSMVVQETVQALPGYAVVHYEATQVKLPSEGFDPLSNGFMEWVGYGPSFASGNNEVVILARRGRTER